MLTIVTPAESYALTTVEAVRAIMSNSTAYDDETVEAWIDQASGVVSDYCNRVLISETVIETFRLDRCPYELILSRTPVATITSITVDGVTLEVDQYEIEKDSGVLIRLCDDRQVQWQGAKISVAYSGGYEAEDVPPAIKRATGLVVVNIAAEGRRDPSIRSLELPEVVTTQYFGGDRLGMPREVMELLEPHRKINV
jgi:hypothetical protein